MGLSHPRYVNWAAQDGRVGDLVFHLSHSGKVALKAYGNSPKRRTPLHLAVIGGHANCIRVLCEAGSCPNAADKDGHTPLHLATHHQHLYCVQLLLELGAIANKSTRFGVIPLHLAAAVGNGPCVDVLVQWGSNVNAQESWGQTALAIATQRDRISCMRTLLHHGADTEIKDYQHKQTPLHIACGNRDEESVLVLLDAACDVHAVNGQGHSALGVAVTNHFYRVVPLLLEYGARLSQDDRAVVSQPLQDYLDQQTETPHSLMQQCRVCVRQSLSPSNIDHLPSLGLPHPMTGFLQNILDLCDGQTIKAKSLQGIFEQVTYKRLPPSEEHS